MAGKGSQQHDISEQSQPVALAYQVQRDKERTFKSNAFKVTLVAMDCLFLGLQPVLVHLSKNSHGTYSFNPVVLNFMIELAKTTFALITLLMFGTGRPGVPMYRSVRSFIADARHNRLLMVPAGLYAINNSLKFTMQLFFKPTTTKMLGNLKVFTIAVLMRTVLGRTFNIIQCEALLLLVAGITINQLKNCPSQGVVEAAIPWLSASLCTLGTVTVPSAASVYNEYALKKHMDTSVHLQNFFLYFYGACFNLCGLLAVSWWKQQTIVQMFAGQTWVTLLLVANNAAQGILSSFFYKFADTILKKYSSTIATAFTALMSYAMFGHELSGNFLIGFLIVLISMHQFFSFGDKPTKSSHVHGGPGARLAPAAMTVSPSMEHIALTTEVGGGAGPGLYAGYGAEGNGGLHAGGLGSSSVGGPRGGPLYV